MHSFVSFAAELDCIAGSNRRIYVTNSLSLPLLLLLLLPRTNLSDVEFATRFLVFFGAFLHPAPHSTMFLHLLLLLLLPGSIRREASNSQKKIMISSIRNASRHRHCTDSSVQNVICVRTVRIRICAPKKKINTELNTTRPPLHVPPLDGIDIQPALFPYTQIRQ